MRLLGLGASTLEGAAAPRQMRLGSSDRWDRVEDALAQVRDRFGENSVSRARLVEEEGTGNNRTEPDY